MAEHDVIDVIQQTRDTIFSLNQSIDAVTQQLNDTVIEMARTSLTRDEMVKCLFYAYYKGDGIVKWKTLKQFCDKMKIDVDEIRQSYVEGECKICHKPMRVHVSSKSKLIWAYNQFRSCSECERKDSEIRQRKREQEKEREEARLRWLKEIPYAHYLKTDEWKETRRKALKRARYKCELCNAEGVLNVHHKTYERRGEEDNKDLIVLCKDCHSKFHDKL